jgi:hypothetical protein
MRRAAIERERARRVWWKHIFWVHWDEWKSGKILCSCDVQVNRFRKGQKQLGCGRPRCYTCHGDKLLGKRTLAQKRADDSMRDGFEELCG